jgi:hypothetical protein
MFAKHFCPNVNRRLKKPVARAALVRSHADGYIKHYC